MSAMHDAELGGGVYGGGGPPAMPSPLPHRTDAESRRLFEEEGRHENWKRWGPYLSERQWGTVREDYSADGSCWDYFPHDHARSRAYRWGEDGLLGLCDRQCRLCFALALWNGQDSILKERFFGLTGAQGNHGEDVKEDYFYLDSTPTHSYMRALYRYPQRAYPYARLVLENAQRGREDPEIELVDTGVYEGRRFFDVTVEYAKESPEDIAVRFTIENRGPEDADIHVIPTLWFRNTWSWGQETEAEDDPRRPQLSHGANEAHARVIEAEHATLGKFAARFFIEGGCEPELLFTENHTNTQRLYGAPNDGRVKDAFHERIVGGDVGATAGPPTGTKACGWYRLRVPAGGAVTVRARITRTEGDEIPPRAAGLELPGGVDEVIARRRAESNDFYAGVLGEMEPSHAAVARQAYAGLLWSKQFYYYVVKRWLEGDPAQPPPPASRVHGRNSDWTHLYNREVISMPDKWEYPWYAAWDHAFHMLPMVRLDPKFAKDQLVLFLREWYMHPNGQIPAYEFALGDVNPPVHAWACWRVYKMTGRRGQRDRLFLARCFQKLLLNFTWWVNRKDPGGRHLFAGGFLGLDNIGVFDRSQPLPGGGHLEQADGTAWMAFYCGTMLSMALELAKFDASYEDMASKFFEHFVAITDAMNTLGGTGLWDEIDGFYYDQLTRGGVGMPLRVRSLVGIIPILAAEVLEQETVDRLPGFRKRMEWFLQHRSDLPWHATCCAGAAGRSTHMLLAIPTRDRLTRVLRYLLDEAEFLSPFGIRSLSKVHQSRPYAISVDGQEYRVDYCPGESNTVLFGGNSNWRGPIWFPLNFLIVEALERYHHFYGDEFKVECPVGSGMMLTLCQVADELRRRLTSLFLPGGGGERPFAGGDERFASDPVLREAWLFHEHFHAETGRGLGAPHQTGWTALVALLVEPSDVESVHEMHRRRGQLGHGAPASDPSPYAAPAARGSGDGTAASSARV